MVATMGRYSFIILLLWWMFGGLSGANAQSSVIADETSNAEKEAKKQAEDSTDQSNAIAEIKSAIESYAKRFQAKDVDALLEHWTSDGVYVNQTTGERVVGHESLKMQFEQLFAEEKIPELKLESESIDLVSPNVALERGVAVVTAANTDPVQTEYRVVYLKRDGRWLIDRVTEEESVITPEAVMQLGRLEWLVGDWVDRDDQSAVEFSCRWTENRSHLYRTFKITIDGEVDSSGLQIIGWDAATKEIRSWLFDSKGNFVRGTWKEDDGVWMVSSVATLSDGGKGSFLSVFTPQEDGTHRWKKINRVLDGRILPSVPESVVQRR
jgi:uncharacterized protein (TIGR02246 family)